MTNSEGSASSLSAQTAVVTQPTVPVNTAEPLISGSPVEGTTLSTTTGTWAGTVDHVRVPVGALRHERRAPRRLELPDDPIGDGLQLHAHGRRHRASAPRPGDGDELRGLGSRDGEPHRRRHGSRRPRARRATPSSRRSAARPSRACHSSQTSARGRVVTPITYTYQWVRCGADGGSADGSNCTFISGATTSSYIPSSDDVGQRLRIRVTATNSLGVQTVASNASAAVLAAGTTTPQAPRNTFLPFISGTMAVGQTLFASLGGWTGTSPIAYAYEWLRCGTDGGTSSGSGCTAIAGATNSQYALSAADLGQRLRVRVTARNSLGTANAISNPTVQVQSTAPEPTHAPDAGPRASAGRRPAAGREGLDPRHERLAAGSPDRRRDRLRAQHGALARNSRSCSVSGSSTPAATPCGTRSSSRARRRSSPRRPERCAPAATAGHGSSSARMRTSRSTAGASSSGSGCASSRTAARGRLEPEARPGRNRAADRRASGASGRRAPARSLRERSLRYPWIEAMIGISRIATMFAILIIGLIAGPAVSL